MENTDLEFTAYSRKLLRCLLKIKNKLDQEDYKEAKSLINELIEDTESDIEG